MTKATPHVSICAIISVRNEAHYLSHILPRLAAQNIDVAVIDHESSDETPAILNSLRGWPVISIAKLPYLGFFSLAQQLESKREIMDNLQHEWLIHHDADELLEHRVPGKTLRDAIEEAEVLDCNAINFEEFTFIPEPSADYAGRNYIAGMRRYYFFQAGINRLNRVWKREAGFENVSHAGHILTGEGIRMSPYTHVLRHYIALNQSHLWNKYINRKFDTDEVAQGWHNNRLHLTREQLKLPRSSPYLKQLSTGDQACFSLSLPAPSHFWNWTRLSPGDAS